MTAAHTYMLDTNTASYLVSGRSQAARQAYLHMPERTRIVLSAISEAEIRFGLENKPGALRTRAIIEEFLTSIQILAWDSEAAKAFSKLRAGMKTAGKSLSLPDLLIASHAVAVDAVLVSHDQAFRHTAPFLTVVDWATDLAAAN